MPLIPEDQVILDSRDFETPGFEKGKDDPLVPEEVEEENFESCRVDFLTWSVSFRRKRSHKGERIDYEGAGADLF